MPVNEMTVEELEAHVIEVKAALEAKRKALVEESISTIRSLAQRAGLTVTIEGVPSKASSQKGTKLPPKFRCPNTGKTWTGRGMRPGWMNGGDPEQFRI